jgi:arylsulfatase A-like enzyme
VPAAWIGKGFETLARSQQGFHGFAEIYDDVEIMRQLRAFYHGSLRYMDDQIARIVNFLKSESLWENTILVFTTDHGDQLGDHGLITKGVKHYGTGIRVPLIVAGAGVASEATDRLTCTLDFYPTFCEWAGVSTEDMPPVEGHSLARFAAGQPESAPWSEVLVSMSGVYTVITEDGWRLTRFPEGVGQMFNLIEDPEEQHDLYQDPDYTDVRQRLLEQLVRAMGRPAEVPHYRVMPLVNGKKRFPVRNRFEGEVPLYE